MIEAAGHVVSDRKIVTDDRALIRDHLQSWIDSPEVDVVISTGGTGLTGRDVTVEAHRDVYEKEIDAFGTVFNPHLHAENRHLGRTIGAPRGGVAGGTYLFALPGSTGACKDAWNEILKWQLDFRHKPCNFVQIMPRLDEDKRRK